MESLACGNVELRVEHREPPPGGGPTLRVVRDGRELLRFDCFARGAHWHRDPGGADEITAIPRALDPLEWTLAELRRDLPGYLKRAGCDDAPDAPTAAAALARAERSLRNPPARLDDLDEAFLRNSRGEKWNLYDDDVLPLWVADMDFPVAEPVRRVVQQAVDRSDFLYPVHPAPTDVPQLCAERLEARFGWRPEPRRIEILTDVVQGIYVALETFTEPGDGVVIQTPIYPPFLVSVRETRRRLVENPLVPGPGGFEVDLDGLRAAADAGTRLLLLCNPHNPSGRALRREELEGIAEVALERDLVVVSDEIHQDLVFPGARHVPFASLSPEVEARTITLTAASKAFNIAGLRCAVACFGSDAIKRRFLRVPRHVRGGVGILGIESLRSAWRHADPWLEQVLAYLEANRDFLAEFAAAELPALRLHPPEATYLAWLDARDLRLEGSPAAFFLEQARVALSDGAAFGDPGRGFVRINFATSRAILTRALERMASVL